MNNLPLDGFLSIITTIYSFMTTNGFNISIGGQTFTLSFSAIMIGICAVSMGITLIHKIWEW